MYTDQEEVKLVTMDKESNNGVDILSGLPDDTLCHILSFLDSKYAIATSVLSTRWKNLCFALPNIDICAKTRKVTLPAEVFTPRLKLTGRFELDYPESVRLPNLKVLHLANVRFANHDCMRRLFEGCKLLEDLSLSRCRMLSKHVNVVDLSCPSLRKLVIKYIFDGSKLIIDTPKLEFFEYEGREVEFQVVNELKCVHTAKISFPSMRDPENLYKLINKMHGVKSLYLSKVLHSRWYSLPILERLTRLELRFFELRALAGILESTPQLQELVIPSPKRYGSVAEAKELSSLQKNVPMCLVKHLEKIVFKSFRAGQYKLLTSLIEFFAQNGKVLKRIEIGIIVSEELMPLVNEQLMLHNLR